MFTKIKIAVLAATLALVPASMASATDFGSATTYGAAAQSGINGSGNIKIDASTISGGISTSVSGNKSVGNTTAVSVLQDADKVALAADGTRKANVHTGKSLSGTFQPGTYYWESSMVSSGDVTIDGRGEHIFVVNSTTVFKNGTKFNFTGGASVCDTIFVLKDSVLIEGNTALGGNFIATNKGINQEGGTVSGRLISLQRDLAIGGSVDVSACVPTTPPVVTPPTTPETPQTPPAPPVVTPNTPETPKPTTPKVQPRVPNKATPGTPQCVKKTANLKVVIKGQKIKSAKLGSSKVKINSNKTAATITVDTRLFKKATTRGIKVTFTDGSSKTFKVKLKKCGQAKVVKKKPKVTG